MPQEEIGMHVLIREWLTGRPFISIAEESRRCLLTRSSDGELARLLPGLPSPGGPDVASPGGQLLISRKDLARSIVRRAGMEAMVDLADRFQLRRIRLYRMP
jgi:hypothetical protein